MSFLIYQHIVFPMAALVLLTFIIVIMMLRSRTLAVKQGSVSAGFFKTYVGDSEPDESRKLSRQFSNLFEAPVLFYAVCLAGLSLELSYGIFQMLAWGYVALRVAHAIVHVGKNSLIPRIIAYFLSWMVLLAMWAILISRILASA